VVPRVELEYVVAFFEVARTKREGVAALLVVAWIVGARCWGADGREGSGNAVCVVFDGSVGGVCVAVESVGSGGVEE
jgi:hypothetical protein